MKNGQYDHFTYSNIFPKFEEIRGFYITWYTHSHICFINSDKKKITLLRQSGKTEFSLSSKHCRSWHVTFDARRFGSPRYTPLVFISDAFWELFWTAWSWTWKAPCRVWTVAGNAENTWKLKTLPFLLETSVRNTLNECIRFT